MQLARLTSLSFVRVGNESRFYFLFSESGREECSCGRNDAPGLRVLGAKLRLHQVFWSQNLAFHSQNATMHPDFSSPDLMTFVQHEFAGPSIVEPDESANQKIRQQKTKKETFSNRQRWIRCQLLWGTLGDWEPLFG